VSDAVQRLEQRAVEHPYRLGIGEIDALLAVRIENHEARQLGAALEQLREVVAALMAVARVEGGFAGDGHGRPGVHRYDVGADLGREKGQRGLPE
jgi:hypothetical protein